MSTAGELRRAGAYVPDYVPDHEAWPPVGLADTEAIARRVVELIGMPRARCELTRDQAMQRLGYTSTKRFWQAVRRNSIPYSRLSPRHVVFDSADIDAVLSAKRVGIRRPKARRLAA